MTTGLIDWEDFRIERRVRKRGWGTARHLMDRLEEPSMVMAQAVGAAGLAWRKHPRAALCLIAAPLLALAATTVVKRAIDRPRPLSHLFRRKGLQSFPSSHTAGKTALVWMLALAFPATRWQRMAMATAATADVALIAGVFLERDDASASDGPGETLTSARMRKWRAAAREWRFWPS